LAHGRTRIRCFPGRAAAVARRPAPALVCARAWERLVLAPAPGGGSSPAPARGKEESEGGWIGGGALREGGEEACGWEMSTEGK